MKPFAACVSVIVCAVSTASAQVQFRDSDKSHLPFRYEAAYAVTGADVDGDGDCDLVFGVHGRNRLFLNDGKARFTDVTATRMPAVENSTYAVALVDVDGDRDLDLVCANGWLNGSRRNSIYLNDGRGGFTDRSAVLLPSIGADTRALAAGDVDGDGDVDLVFGNADPRTMQRNRLFLNDGRGRFREAPLPVVEERTASVVLGDIDGDGDLDLAVGNSGSTDRNRLYRNDGRGRFTEASSNLPNTGGGTLSLAFGDVDRDGDLDLVAGNVKQNRLFLNDGRGRFTDATSTRVPARSDRTGAIALRDIDGDGDLDLVVGNDREQNRLWSNDGSGRFRDLTSARFPVDGDSAQDVFVADLDRDGAVDAVFANQGRSRLYLRDRRTGRFADATAPMLRGEDGFSKAVVLGDVDGDGDLDLVSGAPDYLHVNDGEGRLTLSPGALPRTRQATSAMALSDVDGDGDRDLVLGNFGQPDRLLLNDGRGRFTDATAGRLPVSKVRGNFQLITTLAAGDVDGDGDVDLVFSGDKNQTLLYLNDGRGRFTDVTATHVPLRVGLTYAARLGDVDGDGDLDLFLGNSHMPNWLWRNDGRGRFTDVSSTALPGVRIDTRAAALVDVDGDRDLDLVTGNSVKQNRLFLNDGRGRFADVTPTHMPRDRDATKALAVGDADGDGDVDLFFGNTQGQPPPLQNRLYLNDGRGRFRDATARMQKDSDFTRALAVGDLDGDGDLDLVVGNVFSPNRVYLNFSRQVTTPWLARIGQPFSLDLHGSAGFAAPGQVAVPFLNLRKLPRPIRVPPFGNWWLDLAGLLVLSPVPLPAPAGTARVTFPLPVLLPLVGRRLRAQALVLHGARPVRGGLTNPSSDLVLR